MLTKRRWVSTSSNSRSLAYDSALRVEVYEKMTQLMVLREEFKE